VILRWLFGTQKTDPSEALYGAIVAAARQPRFYAEWLVPDTIDGRFEMMVVHAFLVLERLKQIGPSADGLAQALTDRFFAEMDAALRQAGVGDLSVGKKVRKMAEAFYGRAAAYRSGLSAGHVTLTEAVTRNIYGASDNTYAAALAKWIEAAKVQLAEMKLPDFETGKIRFE
jgi:cytochrome b pre-mRNA-processing protein 3